jgi:hypothetical protein
MKKPEGIIKIYDYEINTEIVDAALFYLLDETSDEQKLLKDHKRIKINFEKFRQIWDSEILISGNGRAYLGKEKFNCLIFTYNFVERFILIFDWEWIPLKSKFLEEDRKLKLKNILYENT